MKKISKIVFIYLLIIFSYSCISEKLSKTYIPRGAESVNNKIDTLIINNVIDKRPTKERSDPGTTFLILIPFTPFGHKKSTPESIFLGPYNLTNTPENISLGPYSCIPQYSFLADLSITIANDLRNSQISNNTLNYPKYGCYLPKPGESVYNIDIELNESYWHEYVTAYGLSIPGVFLSLIGFPASYGNGNLDFTVYVKDSDNNLVDKKQFKSAVSIIGFFYDRFPYLRNLPKIYNNISPDLRKFIIDTISNHLNKYKI